MFKKLAILEEQNKRILELLEEQHCSQFTSNNSHLLVCPFSLPISSLDGIQELEEHLSIEKNLHVLVMCKFPLKS